MAKVYYTQKAFEDLAEIYFFTFYRWSEAQANKYYYFLINSCEFLATNHHVGRKYVDVEDDLLAFLAKKHIIFYKYLGNDAVKIIRILGAEMDLPQHLKK